MTAAEVRVLKQQVADRDEEIARLRRLILDVACTGPGLAALVETGGQTTANPDAHITIGLTE